MAYSYSNTADPQQAAQFGVRQFSVYAGDQWRMLPTLTLTYGVRLDAPTFPDTPSRNPVTEQAYNIRTDVTPEGLQWSPRVGFNYNLGEQHAAAGSRGHRHLQRPHAVCVALEPIHGHRTRVHTACYLRSTPPIAFRSWPIRTTSRATSERRRERGQPARPRLQIPAGDALEPRI